MDQITMTESTPVDVLGAAAGSRRQFLTRTYTHLLGSIVAFTAIEGILFASGLAQGIAGVLLSVNWLFVIGAFIVVSWLTSRLAGQARSQAVQYAALGIYVAAEAILFVPLLFIADYYAPGAIQSAALITLTAFTGLTLVAASTRKDFSFLGGFLAWGGIMALVAVVAGVLFGFQLGTWFSVAMVGLAGVAILFDTSKILRDYPEDRHVAAALQLFASVALMFWYVLRILSRRR